ncbi:MAG: O-antigen ligase family protein, partial [Kiritimatiellae bacterium]|nr:O-antigen ligase family protein [Kiritimatiellia bacterium]
AGLAAWLAASAAWSFWPAGTLRDLSKTLPLAAGVVGIAAWVATGRELRRALWMWASAVTLRLVADGIRLWAERGWGTVFREGRYAADFLWTHPNVASVLGCLAAMVWVGLLPRAGTPWRRRGSIACACACLLYVLFLGSRGPQAVFAAILLLWPVALAPGWKCKTAALALAVLGAAGLWGAADRLNPRFADARTMSGANRRSDIWAHSWMLAKQRPLAGWGYGKKAFVRLVYENPDQRAPDVPVRFPHAHSFWLMLFVEGGAVGTALGAAAWAVLFAGLARRRPETGFQSLENPPKPGSNHWKNGETGFQSLEENAETGFQSLEKPAKPGSNHWKNAETGFQSLENAPSRGERILVGLMAAMTLGYGVADFPDSGVRMALWLLAGICAGVGAADAGGGK